MKKDTVDNIVRLALKEDIATGDITTNLLIPKEKISRGYIVLKENAIVCGLSIAEKTLKRLEPNAVFRRFCKDGDFVKKDSKIVAIKGHTRALLTGERVMLNFLGYLSGIATHTNVFVKKVSPYKVKILDTRKTTPGLRRLEKYAVQCGGGYNHRFDLAEMVLIKDNHRQACQRKMTIEETVRFVKKRTKKTIEVETDNFSQFQQALKANPDIIMLDNMGTKQMKKAVQVVKKLKSKRKPLIEASGGISLKNVRSVAKTGVDLISIGMLTHSQKNINISMELID